MTRPRVAELELDTIARALANPKGDAFGQLYRCYEPLVRWAVGCRVLRWPELVPCFEDIVQDVWIQLLRRREPLLGYDPGRGVPFASFLALVASRMAWKLAKRRLRHPVEELFDEPDDEDWDFTLALARTDVLQRLATQVDALDERSRRFFYGHFVDGRRIKDVGAELGLSENASHVFKLRLEKRLVALAKALLEGDNTSGNRSRLVAATLGALVALLESETVSLDQSARLQDDHERSSSGRDHRRPHGTVFPCRNCMASRDPW
jgi:RNA polymerase sigma factor (sigma-70 family)